MPVSLTPAEQLNAIKTWRYLRLAIVALVVGLAAAILYEMSKSPGHCTQTSISAYYYTPVRGFFSGALIAIGVCLFSLRGSSDIEDLFLNLAGVFAPVVALVPTPNTGSCASVLGTNQDRNVNISNNFFALLVVGFLALLILLILYIVGVTQPLPGPNANLVTQSAKWCYAIGVAVWIAAALVFGLAPGVFREGAHYTAAIAMFVCIWIVVLLNTFDVRALRAGSTYRILNGSIAGVMLVAAVSIASVGLAGGWTYWVIAIESSLIVLFAIFWTVQTVQLWNEGMRP